MAWTVTIQDSGKLTVGDVATGTTDITNSGTAITLSAYVTSVVMNSGAMVGGDSPNRFRSDTQTYQHQPNRLQKAGVANPTWTVKLAFNAFTTDDLKAYSKLCRLVRTTGYKIFYCEKLVEYYKYDENTATCSSIYVVADGLDARLEANTNMIYCTLSLRETT